MRMKKLLLLLTLLPLMTQAQTSRITTLQSARNLAISDGQKTSNHLLKSGESVVLRFKDGQLIAGSDTLTPESVSLRLKSLPRFAMDEDSTAFNNKYGVDFGLLALRRSLNVGQWNSIVIPVSLTGSQLRDAFGEEAQLAAFTRVTDGTIPTVELESIDLQTDEVVLTANQHYLLKPSREPDVAEGHQTSVVYGTAKVLGPVYAIAGVSMESGQTAKYQSMRSDDRQTTIRIRGSYSSHEVSVVANPRYVLGDEGYFSQLTETITQKGFRSYVEDAGNEHPAYVRFYIDGVAEDVSDPTGISAALVNSKGVKSKGVKSDKMYDLQGRRVAQPARGLYIVGGKKVIIK